MKRPDKKKPSEKKAFGNVVHVNFAPKNARRIPLVGQLPLAGSLVWGRNHTAWLIRLIAVVLIVGLSLLIMSSG